MTQTNDLCAADSQAGRCLADLPDTPQCGLNYHFGMLLGVDDFRAEQGFNVGRLRRHQRLLHGYGVVAGYPVDFKDTNFDLQVGPGYAVDVLGRDLALEVTQCVNLAEWWKQHSGDDAYADIADPENATLDLDVVVCHATCLSRPVPAIAEPCASGASDIAYSRLCETVKLGLVRDGSLPVMAVGHHLIRLWLGLEPPAKDAKGDLLVCDAWLKAQIETLLALPAADQPAARAQLAREVWARGVAVEDPAPPDFPNPSDLCLPLVRLKGVHFLKVGDDWQVSVADKVFAIRPLLLSSGFQQQLLLAGVSGLETEGLDLSTLFSGS
jgi:hypothetical protein